MTRAPASLPRIGQSRNRRDRPNLAPIRPRCGTFRHGAGQGTAAGQPARGFPLTEEARIETVTVSATFRLDRRPGCPS
jgi:hypothetical protein